MGGPGAKCKGSLMKGIYTKARTSAALLMLSKPSLARTNNK